MRTARLALEEDGHAHAARDAEGRETALRAAALHLVEQGRGDTRSGRPDRMPERDRAAVDVDAGEVEREVARARNDLRRERLVQLDQVDVGEPAVRLLEERLHGR